MEAVMTAHVPRILPAFFALLALLAPNALRAGVGEWTSNGPDGAVVETLAAHPSHPSIVYAATIRGLFKSVDAGVALKSAGQGIGVEVQVTAERAGPGSSPPLTDSSSRWP